MFHYGLRKEGSWGGGGCKRCFFFLFSGAVSQLRSEVVWPSIKKEEEEEEERSAGLLGKKTKRKHTPQKKKSGEEGEGGMGGLHHIRHNKSEEHLPLSFLHCVLTPPPPPPHIPHHHQLSFSSSGHGSITQRDLLLFLGRL